MSTELRFPSNDKAVDDKIRQLVDQAARVRDGLYKIDKSKTAGDPIPKTERRQAHQRERQRQTGAGK
jgi:hypothetical protein